MTTGDGLSLLRVNTVSSYIKCAHVSPFIPIHIAQTIYNFSFSIVMATTCVGMSLFSVNVF